MVQTQPQAGSASCILGLPIFVEVMVNWILPCYEVLTVF